MRIHFDNVNFSSSSGPNTFATTLAKALFESGHEVCEESAHADVSLVFIEPSGKRLANKIVQRLDGFWFKPEEFLTKNINIKSLYTRTNAVVFQSEFDKHFITKFWGNPTLQKVILNGTHVNPVTSFKISELAKIRADYKFVFVSSANWHPQKRLGTNIKLFQHIQKTIEPNSCLIVLGSNPEMIASNSVFYAGSQQREICDEIYSMSDWMIHTAWLDHSPNVVVHALAQGTPVICSEAGGTSELVKDFGIILREDNKFNFDLIDYDNPPPIDVTQITKLPTSLELGEHADINITSVVKQYIELFQSI